MDAKNATVFFILFLHHVYGYIEKVEVSDCESCVMRLTCRHMGAVIAVLDANFQSDENMTYHNLSLQFVDMSARMALNHRCSGVNHCSFILTKDCPGADKWGFGNVTIKYACISERQMIKYCNKEVLLLSQQHKETPEGFVHNPGYPRFYLGQKQCRWKIKAQPLQHIKITVFDISLLGNPNIEGCTDRLEIQDSGDIIYSTCEQEEPPAEIVSLSENIEVVLSPSLTETLIPRRGILFHYTAVGCSTPPAPRNGYLLQRNKTVAEFSCCLGYYFPDLSKRTRVIECVGYTWNTVLPFPDCDNTITVEEQDHLEAVSAKELIPPTSTMMQEATLYEIVIPSIVILLLLGINSVVLFVIYKYRQRKLPKFYEEEMGTLTLTKTSVSP